MTRIVVLEFQVNIVKLKITDLKKKSTKRSTKSCKYIKYVQFIFTIYVQYIYN